MLKSDISFDTRADGDVRVMTINGHLDTFTISDLKNELKKTTDARFIKIILSLSKVDYANSSTICTIIVTAQQLRKHKGDIKLCGLSDEIRKVFDLVGASKILEIFRTEQEALKSFSRSEKIL